MAYRYDILEPDSDRNKAIDDLSAALGTLYVDSWSRDKEPEYHKPFSLNVAAFAQLWFMQSLRLFIAYDDDKPVGFLIGMVFRPLPYEASVFQVEDWYASGIDEVERGLFDFATSAVRFMGCDEVWVADRVDRDPKPMKGWREANTFKYHRFTKE